MSSSRRLGGPLTSSPASPIMTWRKKGVRGGRGGGGKKRAVVAVTLKETLLLPAGRMDLGMSWESELFLTRERHAWVLALRRRLLSPVAFPWGTWRHERREEEVPLEGDGGGLGGDGKAGPSEPVELPDVVAYDGVGDEHGEEGEPEHRHQVDPVQGRVQVKVLTRANV